MIPSNIPSKLGDNARDKCYLMKSEILQSCCTICGETHMPELSCCIDGVLTFSLSDPGSTLIIAKKPSGEELVKCLRTFSGLHSLYFCISHQDECSFPIFKDQIFMGRRVM